MPPFFNLFNQNRGYPNNNRQNNMQPRQRNFQQNGFQQQGFPQIPFNQGTRNAQMSQPHQNNMPMGYQPPNNMQPQQPMPVNMLPQQPMPVNMPPQQPISGNMPAMQDGLVSFEAIDLNTMKEVQNSQQSPNQGPVPDQRQSLLQELIQNEINCAKYYDSLRNVAPQNHKNYFNEVIANSNERREFFSGLYKSASGLDFNDSGNTIDIRTNYKDGVSNAIMEELTCIKQLTNLYENTFDDNVLRKINILMLKKTWDISFLNLAISQL